MYVLIGNGDFSQLREAMPDFQDLSEHLVPDKEVVVEGLQGLGCKSASLLYLAD